MSNHVRRRRRRRSTRGALPHNTYPDYPDVATLDPDALWRRLVADGVARTPTPVTWLVSACDRIAKAKRTSIEAIFVELDETVKATCGLPLTREPGRP